MAASTTVSRVLCGVAQMYGVSLDDVLANHGVDAQVLANIDARVPGQLDMDLFDELAARAAEPAIGIRLAMAASSLSFDLADYVARNSPDVGSGYRNLLRYQRLLDDHAAVDLRVEGETARLVHRVAPGLRFSRHATECLLGTLVVRGRSLSGVDWNPTSVSLRDPPPANGAPYRELFGVDVAFAQPVTEVVFPRTTLQYPNVKPDPALYAIFEREAQERVARLASPSGFIGDVRRELSQLLRGEVPVAADVAGRLGMSKRTLHHRLLREGRTYQQIVDDVRLAMATAYLADPRVKAVEVAFLLGFSDASAFYRAFRRWTGKTPIEFRATAAASDGSEGHRP